MVLTRPDWMSDSVTAWIEHIHLPEPRDCPPSVPGALAVCPEISGKLT